MHSDAAPRGSFGRIVGGLVVQARYGRDVIAARARVGLAARWLQAARVADVEGQRSEAELELLAVELRRAFLREIASRPRRRRT